MTNAPDFRAMRGMLRLLETGGEMSHTAAALRSALDCIDELAAALREVGQTIMEKEKDGVGEDEYCGFCDTVVNECRCLGAVARAVLTKWGLTE